MPDGGRLGRAAENRTRAGQGNKSASPIYGRFLLWLRLRRTLPSVANLILVGILTLQDSCDEKGTRWLPVGVFGSMEFCHELPSLNARCSR